MTYNTAADAGGGSPQNTYDIVGNVDYNWNEKTQISAKYALYSENDFAGTVNTSPYSGYETGQTNLDNHLTISLTHTFSPSLISKTASATTALLTSSRWPALLSAQRCT